MRTLHIPGGQMKVLDPRQARCMKTLRYCDDCPWNYFEPHTESCGCMLFGEECKECKKFDEEVCGCYYSQKKLERMAYARNKKNNHAQKIAESYSTDIKFFFKNHNRYTPNRKGGHRHNHARNVLERKLNKSKASRKRCHNYLNKGYVYKFFANRCPKRVK